MSQYRASTYRTLTLDQIVITPPASAPGTLYRPLPYSSPYGAGAGAGLAAAYSYTAPFPIGDSGFAASDYPQRPLPPPPQNPYFPTVPRPTALHYPPTSVGHYRTPLNRPSSILSLDTYAPSESRHHRSHYRHAEHRDLYNDGQYESGDEYDSSGQYRHRNHKKRDRRHRRRKERHDEEAYHGGYYAFGAGYAPEAGYEGRH